MKTFKLYSKFSSLKPNTLKVQSYKLCNNKIYDRINAKKKH